MTNNATAFRPNVPSGADPEPAGPGRHKTVCGPREREHRRRVRRQLAFWIAFLAALGGAIACVYMWRGV
jgi:hypothetical protein